MIECTNMSVQVFVSDNQGEQIGVLVTKTFSRGRAALEAEIISLVELNLSGQRHID